MDRTWYRNTGNTVWGESYIDERMLISHLDSHSGISLDSMERSSLYKNVKLLKANKTVYRI